MNVDEVIGSFFCPGPFYFYIFDFPTFSFSYLQPNLKEIFGADPESFTTDDFLSRVHPDDISHMANAEKMAFDFIIKHKPLEKRKKYIISYCLRMKMANGSYKLFLQQAMALTLDQEGNLGKVVGVQTDISHITTFNNYKISLIGIDGEPSFYNVDPQDVLDNLAPSGSPFTNREMEILKLLAEGFSPKEISEKLFIASGTVLTHKKNLLSKSNCKNSIELVAKCIREGLI